jgi:hypothetical protein
MASHSGYWRRLELIAPPVRVGERDRFMNMPIAHFLSHLSQFLAHLLHSILNSVPGAKVGRVPGKTMRNGADDDHGGA